MDRTEEYRKKAADCRRMAATWARQEHRLAWLDLAESWQALAGLAAASPDAARMALDRLQPGAADALH